MTCNINETIAEVRSLTAVGENSIERFAVVEGKLVPSHGGFLEGPTRKVKDFLYGGHNQEEVREKIVAVFFQVFDMVKQIEGWDLETKQTHFTEIKVLSRELKLAASVWKYAPEYERKNFERRRGQLKAALKDVPLPEGYQRPPFDLNRPWRWEHIKLMDHIKKGQSLEEFLQIAEAVKGRRVPAWKTTPVKVCCIATRLIAFPMLMLSNLEQFEWFINNLNSLEKSYYPPTEKLLAKMAANILQDPNIVGSMLDEKHIQALESLSKEVMALDLGKMQFVEMNESVDEDKIGITEDQLIRITGEVADKATNCRLFILPPLPENQKIIPSQLNLRGFKEQSTKGVFFKIAKR